MSDNGAAALAEVHKKRGHSGLRLASEIESDPSGKHGTCRFCGLPITYVQTWGPQHHQWRHRALPAALPVALFWSHVQKSDGCWEWTVTRHSFLIMSDFERLEEWCRLVRVVFHGAVPYLVGSANVEAAYRDVDIRVILPDSAFDRYMRRRPERIRYLNRAMSIWGQQETGLPIDFQVQRQTEANAKFGDETRNPMGIRDWALLPTSGIPA